MTRETPIRSTGIAGTPLGDAAAGLDLCVHCGFCLQACPTYLVLEDENDSPRGRLLLMRSAVDGQLDLHDDALRTHLDRCLGCRACETACPSGVPYGHLLEAARATLMADRPRSLVARLTLAVIGNDAMRGAAMTFARLVRAAGLARLLGRLPGRVGTAAAMLDATRPGVTLRAYAPKGTGARGRVAVLTGCVMEGLFTGVNRATERTLATNDYALVEAPGQGCCGALHAHAGALARARMMARRNIAAFERSGAEFIAVNSAGCGAMMKEYGELLNDDADWSERARRFGKRVRDVSELLAAAGPRPGGALPGTVAYDAPCHLLHAQKVQDAPLHVMRAVPGLEVRALPDAERCCGGAGIYNLVQPQLSRDVLRPKLRTIAESGASLVATGNPGCHMQIGAGLLRSGAAARCVHPVELLDASYGVADHA